MTLSEIYGKWKGKHRPEKREERRDWSVSAYVGANGGGKTAAMVWDTLPSLEQGRPVLSTVRLLDYLNPRECSEVLCEANPLSGHFKRRPTALGLEQTIENAKRTYAHGEDADLLEVDTEVYGVHAAAHPLWVPFVRPDQLLSFRFGDVLADEITGVASSRQSVSMADEVLNRLQQLRRADLPFRYTCPAWDRADKGLREPTQTVTVCEGFLKTEARDGAGARMWKSRRLFKWTTYDAKSLDRWTEGKSQQLDAEVTDWHYGPTSPVFKAYDTFDEVLSMVTVSASGRCARCGGTRRVPACSCASHGGAGSVPGTAAGPAQRVALVPVPSPTRAPALPPGPSPAPAGGGRRRAVVAEDLIDAP